MGYFFSVMPTKKALIVGINYTGQPNTLKGCINDAWNVAHFLVNNYGFEPKNMRILTDNPNAPRGGLPKWLPKHRVPRDDDDDDEDDDDEDEDETEDSRKDDKDKDKKKDKKKDKGDKKKKKNKKKDKKKKKNKKDKKKDKGDKRSLGDEDYEAEDDG